jgi:hypothetical protein
MGLTHDRMYYDPDKHYSSMCFRSHHSKCGGRDIKHFKCDCDCHKRLVTIT